MNRSSKAALSPQEIASLRRLKANPRHSIANSHRYLLLSMSLVTADADELKLTDIGCNRLATEADSRDEPRPISGPAKPMPAA